MQRHAWGPRQPSPRPHQGRPDQHVKPLPQLRGRRGLVRTPTRERIARPLLPGPPGSSAEPPAPPSAPRSETCVLGRRGHGEWAAEALPAVTGREAGLGYAGGIA